jgi:hypothetical protein
MFVSFLLGDPMSWNTPGAVAETPRAALGRWPKIDSVYLHLHDARGMAVASIYAAIQECGERDLHLDTTAASGDARTAATGARPGWPLQRVSSISPRACRQARSAMADDGRVGHDPPWWRQTGVAEQPSPQPKTPVNKRFPKPRNVGACRYRTTSTWAPAAWNDRRQKSIRLTSHAKKLDLVPDTLQASYAGRRPLEA